MTKRTGRLIKKIVPLCVAAGLLSGCAVFDGNVFEESFWASSPFKKNDQAELGLAEMAKGNYVTAEGFFQRALKANSRDIHALLGSGILYQNTGQLVKAREMYEAVLAIRPDDSEQFVVWNELTTRPASQVASVNLSLLETGGTAQAAMRSGMNSVPIGAAPQGDVMLGRTSTEVASTPMSMNTPAAQGGMQMESPSMIGGFQGGDSNVMSRFATLKALRDQGLITQDEYNQRRQSSIGALLPLTSPPPAAGLDRPVPTTEQISARLRAIGRALEMRAISVSQHSAERNMILDAMMPSAPVMVAEPTAPPRGLMEGADAIRRLEKLRDAGYITADEYARERQAIELSVQSAAGPGQPAGTMAKAAPAPEAQPMAAKAAPKPSGPQPAVHLASYRSAKQAESGWLQIKRAHGNVLGSLDHEVSRVTLGSKGTYYRLKAGPLPSVSEAKSLCSQLKKRRQFCDTTVMNDG
ncbi:SHOCT domain-containing protein [Thalassospiraceae bacterium LMO-JJ14]|nr:SHOCT domain-containing protein [Thalassospiraceae bacterium LMO-JJ14]